ncbi:hypothetical protein P171DRAFT_427374 [Karstenula rhodostoma CBS 690.94]|uniref:Uncharacterized protein n=1 Tax=Karstenula rhodostoma CBS 690.94 TaxID=1392251 RepID=A0A9P4UGD7_9PLEO|nr:hypothetical protein P171DRAFT_427374 [Karstenula rhodostoma CBS 690.94]
MHSTKATAAGAVAAAPSPNGRTQHKSSPSMGSLYEVLADLDENQLEYLLQEMNHTGHQNVTVSQAVTAFDSQSPPDSLSAIRASMLPPAPGHQRQLSKSQQGKLRLQTAFQRAPSLKQRPQTETRGSQHTSATPVQVTPIETSKRGTPGSRSENQPSAPEDSKNRTAIAKLPSPEPEIQPPKRGNATTTTTANARRPTTSSIRSISAYKHIPRPDFHLPPGITVPDLLQLLEVEFYSSGSPFLSPSPAVSLSRSPAPTGGRTLRRHSSRLDMALDAERNASGFEEIGLGMLEPRGSSPASLRGSAPVTPVESFARGFGGETPSPVVLEGIFDVLENR